MSNSDSLGFAEVVLDSGQSFTYAVDPNMLGVEPGARVEVRLRGNKKHGLVTELKARCNYPNAKPIEKVLSAALPIDLQALALWIHKYYLAPLPKVYRMLVPLSIRKEQGKKEQLFVFRNKSKEELRELCVHLRNTHPSQAKILEAMLKAGKGIFLSQLLETTGCSKSPVDTLVKKGSLLVKPVNVDKSPLQNEEYFPSKPLQLTEEQNNAKDAVCNAIGQFQTFLLHGVTGSGKTEVYLQCIQTVLDQGLGTIMLVPEIALTAQTTQRFISRFGKQIAILHHRLSHGERLNEWRRIREGKAPIVIGARSAIFSPVPKLGLIIVDEEHDNSYKQEDDTPCYSARDVAVVRGKLTSAPVILGSATPSLESYYNAQEGKYQLLKLKARADHKSLPKTQIVDMRREYEKNKGYTLFSDALLMGIKERFEKGEQSLIFLNRRGYHSNQSCMSCGEIVKCQDCDTPMTYHRQDSALRCHLCGHEIAPPPKICPSCKEERCMKFKGVGTEQVERTLYALIPDIRIIRMDADTTRHKGSHQRLIRDFRTGKGDVLVGTQMIAKGLHFPQVTLVGVLNSDSGLGIPDFRASEQVFQLITQVAGRAGRGESAGQVFIQSQTPENTTLLHASAQDYPAFYRDEIDVRKIFGYPPFSHMAKIQFSGEDLKGVEALARAFREALIPRLSSAYQVYPVSPCGHALIKRRHRLHVLVLGPSIYHFNAQAKKVLQCLPKQPSFRIKVDIDPSSTYF